MLFILRIIPENVRSGNKRKRRRWRRVCPAPSAFVHVFIANQGGVARRSGYDDGGDGDAGRYCDAQGVEREGESRDVAARAGELP